MTLHIKRAIAAMTAVLMLLTLVPTAALPTIQLPDLSAPSATVDTPANNADATPSTDVDNDNTSANDAAPSTNADAHNAPADSSTDAPANNAVANSEVTDSDIIEQVLASEDGVVMGEDGTVYTDIDNDGDIEAVKGDAIEDDENFDPSDDLKELVNTVEQGKTEEPEYLATSAASAASPYEPLYTDDASDPFLPGGDAWINQDKIYYGAPGTPSYPFTEWAANTSFLNTSAYEYDNGRATKWVFPDVDLIDSSTFGSTHQIGSASEGYAYNRNDAAYGKYGVTIDRNRRTTTWTVGKTVDLSETPYLAFSIEQVDGAKLALAVQIGTPTSPGASTYTYRWYTITDSNPHLGIDYDTTKSNTVMPAVQISAAGAPAPVDNPAAYVDGALTGCIDMVYWLPQIDTANSDMVRYRINQVQVSSIGQAARINYLYFLNQGGTVISPQVNNGSLDLGGVKDTAASADDLNGWRNAAALTLTMTGESMHKMKINSNTSGVVTYTVGGKKYFDVVIPVRKWLNFSADSRTVAFAMYNASTGASGVTGTGEVEFSMWGNAYGGTPLRYRDGVFHSHGQYEDLLFITGSSTDTVGQPYCYWSSTSGIQTMDIDRKYNSYFAYGNSNQFDFIQSPYIKPAVYVSDPDNERYGWAYVSSFRITVPYNTGTYNFDSIVTRPIEDGLNDFTQESDGTIKSDSYDGGTGVQPVLTTGTVSSEPAAYGPHYYSSEYGVTDLLDRSSTRNTIYGVMHNIKTSSSGVNFRTYPGISGDGTLQFTTPQGDCYTPVYAQVTINGTKFYALPAITSDGKGVTWGWCYATYATIQGNPTGCQIPKNFGSYTSLSAFQTAYPTVDSWVDAIYAAMQDKWVWSNLICDTNSGPAFSVISADKYATYYDTNEFSAVPAAFTNIRYVNTFNGLYSTENTSFRTTNTTDTVFRAHQTTLTNTFGNAMRILSDPVSVKATDYLYYDIQFGSYGSSSLSIFMADSNNKVHVYYVDTTNKTFIGYSSGAPARKSGVARIPFKPIFDNHGLTAPDAKMKVIGIAMGTWLASGSNGYNDDFVLRRLEVHSEKIQYKDRVVKNDSGKIVDGFNVLEDACNEKLTTRVVDAVRGRRGWHLASYKNLDTFVFRPTIGHYRVRASTSGQLVLNSDRSFNLSDYKYMYLSYSVRDPDVGYGLASSSSTGIDVVLKTAQADQVPAIAQNSSGKFAKVATYDSTTYSHVYRNSLNTAVDMSALSTTAINQIVFYFKNTTGKQVTYYINYLYFTNDPPSAGYQKVTARPYYHNYYLMDNTMGRYARRFPTTTNPSGQVTSTVAGNAAGRVNPLIITRGQKFYTGTYYNGTPLSSYKTTANATVSTTSKVYPTVMFYKDFGSEHLIDQYYKLGSGVEEFSQYDAYWCYNRWPVGWALQRYIGYNKSSGAVNGSLMNLYACDNNVFLRNGIEPIKYQTTFDTQGGQMVYGGSSDINTADQNGLIENENNYYITNAVITDYFVWPTTDGKRLDPVKYGYTFEGWFTGEDNPQGVHELMLYHTKQNPVDITFYAHWTPISGTTRYTATFKKTDNETTWFSRQADAANYEIVIPWVTQIETASGKVPLVGWTVSGDTSGKVYTPGMKLTLTKNVTFLPYVNTSHDSSLTITVNNGAKLCLYQDSMAAADLKEIVDGYKGIVVTKSGSGSSQITTYTNIPRYTVVVAKPYSTSSASSRAWRVTNTGYTSFSVANGTATETIASYDTYYRFAASTDVTLNYVTATDQTALIWTSPRAYVSNRQMMFYSQFDVPENATILSYGTLYTKDSQFANIVGSATSNTAIATALGNAMKFTSTACTATSTSAVRFVKATNKNETNQYYLMVTENKGNAVTYYARGYVQYKVGSTTSVAYSDIISMASVGASMDPLGQ